MRIELPLVRTFNKVLRLFSNLCSCNMKLRGGVIIIGSLLWDNAGRSEWRGHSLDPLENKVPLALRIRYGRESGDKRCHTYTMILSNHPTTALGQSYILGLNKKIETKEMLRQEIIALAKAEGVWTEESSFLAKRWGAVGLLINPSLNNAKLLKSMWVQLFRHHRCDHPRNGYDASRFCIDDEPSVIDADGFLQIDWSPEMNAFDFLLATPTAPKPRTLLSAKAIAHRMNERNYRKYFDGNRASGITTYQDDEILDYLTIDSSS